MPLYSEKVKELALAREALRSNARQWSALSQALERAVNGAPAEARLAAGELLANESLERARTLLGDVDLPIVRPRIEFVPFQDY